MIQVWIDSFVFVQYRLLRDRDDEAVGSGVSRGVGFVRRVSLSFYHMLRLNLLSWHPFYSRLVNRKEALHYVQKLHGLAVDGKDHHIQCRMADSKAQKEFVLVSQLLRVGCELIFNPPRQVETHCANSTRSIALAYYSESIWGQQLKRSEKSVRQ